MTGTVAQWINVLVERLDDLSLVSRTHMIGKMFYLLGPGSNRDIEIDYRREWDLLENLLMP